jgi:hypothetical protein
MCAENVKRIYSKISFVTIPVLLLAATVAITVTISEDAFARERYSGDSTSQAAAVSNECLNPILDSNTIDNMVGVGNCAGTVSQQDESGSAAAPITSQTANPDIELQRTTTPTEPQPPTEPEPEPEPEPQTCEECFTTFLSPDEQAEFLRVMDESFDQFTPDTDLGDICILTTQAFQIDNFIAGVLGAGIPEGGIPGNNLVPGMNLSQDRIDEIVECLHRVLGF